MGLFSRSASAELEYRGEGFYERGAGYNGVLTEYILHTNQGNISLGYLGEGTGDVWNYGSRPSDILDLCGVEIVSVEGVPFDHSEKTEK